MSHNIRTRNFSNCPVFGAPCELPETQLPTYYDVMKYYLWVRYDLKPDITAKDPTVEEISVIVAGKVVEIWNKASIPTVINKRVLQMIRAYHDKYRNLMKSYKGRKTNEKYVKKLEEFKLESEKLFDISSCKCHSWESCKCEIKPQSTQD